MTRRPLNTAETVDTPRYTKGGGWKASKEARMNRGGFVKEFQVPEDESKLVKFLDDEPFESYYRHWLRNRPKGERQTFVCLGEDCPLCEIDTPSFLVLFNVVDMLEDRNLVRVWSATPGPAGKIEAMAESGKWYAPIGREMVYFDISKKKESTGFFGYSVVPVKDRDLADEWDVEPLSAEELATLTEGKYGPDYVKADPRTLLREIADGLSGE